MDSSWEHGQETPHLLRNTQVMCRDDRKLTLVTLQICIQDMPSSNLASEEEIFNMERFTVFIGRIMLHFKTQLCGPILRDNVGECGKFRVGNSSSRFCENDLTWSGVNLKKIGSNCWSIQHRGGSEQYVQNFNFRLEGMRVPRWLKHRWEYNIKMDFIEIKYEAVVYSHVSRDWNQWRLLWIG
jgi:hypothetical protein